MTKENRMITVQAYRSDEGQPTCAAHFQTGEVCPFYRAVKFGCGETCVFAGEDFRGMPKLLQRRGKDGNGTLIPIENCPVWNKPLLLANVKENE